MTANTTTTGQERIDRGTMLALAAMALSVIIIANDFTAFSVALPAIERDFHSNLSTVQWVVNAYALVFGVVIVTGGRLADMFGRRRIFFVGTAIFAAFSLLAGLARGEVWLISCRALMGIGGALMWPAILGMTFDALPESKAGIAGGLVMAAAGFGNALGPMVGGLLTDVLSWRWIFFLNLPIAFFGVVATMASIKAEQKAADRERLDYGGVVTLTVGLISLLLALDESTRLGWASPWVIALLCVSVGFLSVFAVVERREGMSALVPPDAIGDRDFAAACGAVLLMSAVFFAALLYLPQFMTRVLGLSPLRAGVGMLPMMATFALVSLVAGPLYERVGPKATVTGGAALLTTGMFLLAPISRGDGYTSLLPGMFVLGAGVGLFYSSITTAGVTALDPSRASLAGGIVYMFQVAGGSVGLGLNTAIVLAAGASLTSFVDGIGHAFLLDALLACMATGVSVAFVGGRLSQAGMEEHLHLHHPRHRRHLLRAHP